MTSSADIVVRVAEWAVQRDRGRIVTLGVGSCVALMLLDPATPAAGMAHVLLPSASLSKLPASPARVVESAVPLLVAELLRQGGSVKRMVAKIVGGASMFANLNTTGSLTMGERNVQAARIALRSAGIPLVAERVGGERGRSVYLDVATGEVLVRSVGADDVVL